MNTPGDIWKMVLSLLEKRLQPVTLDAWFDDLTAVEFKDDTLLLHTLHYDSVFIRQERYQDRSRDTVYLHDRSVEYRYRLLRDTIREIRHDSIPYEVRIVEPSSPRLFPSLPQSLGWIALILIAGSGCRLLGRFLR